MEKFWQQLYQVKKASSTTRVCSCGYHLLDNWRIERKKGEWLTGQIIINLTGNAEFIYSGQVQIAQRGSVALHFSGEEQIYRCPKRWEAYYFNFYPSKILSRTLASYGIRNGALLPVTLSEGQIDSMREIFLLDRMNPDLSQNRAVNLLERILYWTLPDDVSKKNKPIKTRLKDIGDMIRTNPQNPFSVADLAKMTGFSESRFAHLFKEEYGESVKQFVIRQKMEEAQKLLQTTGLSAAEIAQKLGYENIFHFYHYFRKFTGKNTSEMRNNVAS